MLEKEDHGRPVEALNKELAALKKDRDDLARRLGQARKMAAVGVLASGIAHDLGNALFSVVGFAEMLGEDLPPGSPLNEKMTDLVHAAHRAQTLVRQIPSLTRSEEYTQAIRIQYLIKEILKITRTAMPATIAMRQRIVSDCAPVRVGPAQIYQIVTTMITDACQGMETNGGTLTVTLEEIRADQAEQLFQGSTAGRYVVLCVGDTGEAVSDVHPTKPHDGVFTASGGDKEMVGQEMQGMLHQYGGGLQIHSTPGQGAERRIYLPVDDAME